MSLQPRPIGPVPEETARVARAVFPRSNVCLRLRDELGPFTTMAPSLGCFRVAGSQPKPRGGLPW